MAIRKIIEIDEDKCDGCGLCADACHEGAIRIQDGKARLVSDTYCDGLGDCLKECPQGAITIIEREASDYDEAAVAARKASAARPGRQRAAHPAAGGSRLEGAAGPQHPFPVGGGCPGSALRSFGPPAQRPAAEPRPGAGAPEGAPSQLSHWPVQLKLVPPGAPFLQGADLLICADCVPFAVPDFHESYLRGKSVLVGCPKLDDLSFYREKLEAIFRHAGPASITVLKMEVPCCNGIALAALEARNAAAPCAPVTVVTVGLRGGVQRIEKIPEGVAA